MTSTSKRLRAALAGLLLAGLTGAIYAQVADFGFVEFDDDRCITENPVVSRGLSWEGAARVFRAPVCANYTPLAWLSHMLDIQLYGLDATGHHVTNAVLHVLNTLLLFGWLSALTGTVFRSALVAALFALHPLHVESVAWVAERRDVLSGLFGLGSLWAYTHWARTRARGAWAATFVCLLLGLLSKSMLVTWPLLFLLLDYWPLRRLQFLTPARGAGESASPSALLLEKLPFFLLVIAFGVLMLLSQSRGGAMSTAEMIPLDVRLGNALVSYVAYLGKTLWPAGLAVLYPHPSLPGGADPWSFADVAGAGAVLLAVTLVVWRLRRHGYLVVGWLWFGISLAPVIGVVQIGQAAMADRYTYLPLIGIFLAGVWGLHDWVLSRSGDRSWARPAAVAGALTIVASFAAVSWRQIGYWRNSITLLERAADVTRGNLSAHYNLANVYKKRGDLKRARHHYESAIEIHPTMVRAHYNFANMLRGQERLDEAIDHYWEAALYSPDDPRLLRSLGATVRERDGNDEVTIAFLRGVLGLEPQWANGWVALGNLLRDNGRLDKAIESYGRALEIDPDEPVTRRLLDEVLAARRRSAPSPG